MGPPTGRRYKCAPPGTVGHSFCHPLGPLWARPPQIAPCHSPGPATCRHTAESSLSTVQRHSPHPCQPGCPTLQGSTRCCLGCRGDKPGLGPVLRATQNPRVLAQIQASVAERGMQARGTGRASGPPSFLCVRNLCFAVQHLEGQRGTRRCRPRLGRVPERDTLTLTLTLTYPDTAA